MLKQMGQGYSLIEILIVVVIIGILVTFSAPQFAATKERALDKEAQANLRLIQAAQRIYRMESTFYYPYGGGTVGTADINDYLKLSLPESNPNWAFTTSGGSSGQGVATRSKGTCRRWTLASGPDDPVEGACP